MVVRPTNMDFDIPSHVYRIMLNPNVEEDIAHRENILRVDQWCNDQFGEGRRIYTRYSDTQVYTAYEYHEGGCIPVDAEGPIGSFNRPWYAHGWLYYFRDLAQAMVFKVRWV